MVTAPWPSKTGGQIRLRSPEYQRLQFPLPKHRENAPAENPQNGGILARDRWTHSILI